MGTAADQTAIFSTTTIPTEIEAREYYRALSASRVTSGVIPGGGAYDGSVEAFEATADGSSSLPLGEGRGMMSGIFGKWLAGGAGAHADRHASLARIDLIVMEADFVANTTELVILTGTPAASPAVPTPTQNETLIWQEPIWQVAIDAGGSAPTIVSGDLTDRRTVIGHGAWLLPDGTAAAPSVSFVSDTNTGMYRGAADEIYFSTGGTENLRLTTNNIRMASSSSQIYNVGSFRGNKTTGTVSAPNFSFDGDSNTGMYSDSSDSLSFATAGVQRLDIDGGGIKGKLAFQAPYGSSAAPGHSFDGDTNTGMYRYSADRLGFAVGGAYKMLLNSTILFLGTIVQSAYGTVAAPAFSFTNDTNTGMYRSSTDTLSFSTGGANRLSINSTGISTFYNKVYIGSGTAGEIRVFASGGSESLRVAGTVVRSSNIWNLTTGNAANVYIAANNTIYHSTSSLKYKRDVEDMWAEEADKIYDMTPKYYKSATGNDPEHHSYFGLIAEELEPIEPRVVQLGPGPDCECPEDPDDPGHIEVHTDECLQPEGVAYDRLVPHLIVLAKRYRDQITDLETRLQLLEKATA